MKPDISVVTVAYNSGPPLLRALEAVAGEEGVEAIVVNNGDGAEELEAAAALPSVRVLEPGRNLGYAAGSNLGARAAAGETLVFLNPDTVAAAGALRRLAETVADPAVAIAMPRLCLLDEPGTLNSSGNVLHVSGLAWVGGHGDPAESVFERRDIAYASGAALAVRAERFWALGGFTEELFMYQEDLELAWRAHLAGLRVVVEPRADVYHDYAFDRNPGKQYLLERNRLVFVLSAYSGRLLLVALPILVAAEAAVTLLALRQRWLREKAAGWAWCASHARWLVRHRRETQRLRRVRDADLAGLLAAELTPAVVDVPALVRAANPLLAAYWRLARRAL